MLTSILRTLFITTLLLNTISFAEEGDIERLMVPETQEAPPPMENQMGEINPEDKNMLEEIQEQTTEQADAPEEIIENHNPNEEATVEQEVANSEESTEEASNPTAINEAESSEKPQPDMNAPSSEDLEARHAEETELREVGAGEEPTE